MGQRGKLTAEIEYRSGGDVFHELFRFKPHQISSISPDKVQGCDLHEGEWGTAGSKIFWKYTDDGKDKVMKQEVEAIDEEKKSIVLKALEGDVLEIYKAFKVSIGVTTTGDIDLVTWIVEYEKRKEDVEDPLNELGLLIDLTRDIEAHHATRP
ncbi:MLP-like protein 34-like [Dorcoceras hygrometricum]|uniref:MLP-like protein 34-like n=1 Tax=Dorcoceras hygrometricum TaxID=472368 RepID=A0A2Z7BAW6_9LAMI|nr:MLP-like protein 34-like [Dorcoceras hygrometricum]